MHLQYHHAKTIRPIRNFMIKFCTEILRLKLERIVIKAFAGIQDFRKLKFGVHNAQFTSLQSSCRAIQAC